MNRLLIFLTFIFLLSACDNRNNVGTPTRLLSEKEMIDIMTDVQIIEAEINYHKSAKKSIGQMPKEYYRQLFEHYGITDSIYAENLRYYTQDPAIMERIMDSVTNRLAEEQAKLPAIDEGSESRDNTRPKTTLPRPLNPK